MKQFLISAILMVATSVLPKEELYAQEGPLRIAAASDLKFALDSIVGLFEKTSGRSITVTYGSSGKLYEQINNGAPFHVFFSADLSYPEKLKDHGLTIGNIELYGIGRIVIWSRMVNPEALRINSLVDKKVNYIAIANPQHAPYGKRAEETLQFYGLYEKVKSKLVFGENISQASQFLYSGSAEVGIIALSLALSPPMQKQKGKFWIIPQESHQALKQGFVILKTAGDNKTASDFKQFLQSVEVREIFRKFGFVTDQPVLND